ncbi:hypothetical protein SAMN02982929_03618 [Saccharopolyspora kobensis]|uniref:Uncharacterized protein n=1 Tax=Saccharopolyspora kobensis TaxID=146035 RepID=A0A1H6CW60_9PSEU|nr:hypothetical protein [Saccharopolyspora kobensis]SEG77261.1 hypothetical protein SAMN02982929_03618 [Saccharopolyspora kobensis]SFD01772.1 hypothetical protein SAMN05216506_102212 [Saccharopolyspora kobensis]
MHRSWLRTKASESKTRVTNKVAERAKVLVPRQRDGEAASCMVCGRWMRPTGAIQGDGRVCSPACARQWAQGL